MSHELTSFTDILGDVDEIADSQPLSLLSPQDSVTESNNELDQNSEPLVRIHEEQIRTLRPSKYAGQRGDFRSVEEIAEKYRHVFIYPYFNLVQSKVMDDALYTDKSMVVCAPTGSGKTVIFELAIVQLLMELEDKNYNDDFKIIYMAPVKALCTERLTEWHSRFTRLGLLCIEVTGDTDVDFSQLKPYRIIITTPEKWDMLTRRWRDHRSLVEVIKLFLIDEVHILNDELRGPVLEAVVSRMKTIELSAQSAHRIETLQKQYQGESSSSEVTKCPRIRFVAVSATVNNPEDVAAWLGTTEKPAVFYKFGDESRPVKLNRVVEGYPCPEGTSIFKFDIILNYKLWPVIQKHHNGKPTLIFCNTRKSVVLTAEALAKELTVSFTPEQKAKLTALASTLKTKKLQLLILNGVGCHHAGLLYEERTNIEQAFRNRDLPILITTTTLAMGVNLPAHLVIIKNTQRYVNGAYEEYSMSTILQMVGRAGRPQFDTEATAVIMTRLCDKPRYQALVGGSEPLQSYLHKRLPENLNSEAALGTVTDVAQCVQWLRSTFLFVRAARDPKWYLGLPTAAPMHLIFKKIEELCVKAMNMLATAGLIRMDEASCIESTDAGKLMSIYYLDLETMKLIMKIQGTETLEQLLMLICESHELSDMHLRVDERRCLNTLNRNNAAATIRFPMKGKINSRQMKLNCIIQAVLGCLPIPDPSLNQEAMKVMRIAERICRCLVTYVTRSDLVCTQPAFYTALLNSLVLSKCVKAHLWENSPYVSRQLKGIGPTFSTLLASAGKTTFTLLLESHPRDLERIMNKGPPAGNLLRKQISLLPQYSITMLPIDEKRVSVQILLINQSFLAENQDNLTAGSSHVCYVVVGDSENHVLLYTHFIDKDLIGIYNGTINYEITRKHSIEHKVFVNCISSKFVGIDTQCEYVFKSLEPVYSKGTASLAAFNTNVSNKKPAKKQTNITDVYQERKRKNVDEISQSKEKKRRDNALLEKIKHLKESFGNAVKEIKKDLDLVNKDTSSDMNIIEMPTPSKDNMSNANDFNEIIDIDELDDFPELTEDEFNTEDVIVDQHIDNILNDIENEITNNRRKPTNLNISNVIETQQNLNTYSGMDFKLDSRMTTTQAPEANNIKSLLSFEYKKPTRKTFCPPKKKQNTKSNFSFIDSLAKENLEEEKVSSNKSSFSDTIKDHIEKFLQKQKNKCLLPDKSLEKLIETKGVNDESKIIDPTENVSNSNKENIIDLSPGTTKFRENGNNISEKENMCESDQNFRLSPDYFVNQKKNETEIELSKDYSIQSPQVTKLNDNDLIILSNEEIHTSHCIPGDLKSVVSCNAKMMRYETNDTDSESYLSVAECNNFENISDIQSHQFSLPKSTNETYNNGLNNEAKQTEISNLNKYANYSVDRKHGQEDIDDNRVNDLPIVARYNPTKLSTMNSNEHDNKSDKIKSLKLTENILTDNKFHKGITDVDSYKTTTIIASNVNKNSGIRDTYDSRSIKNLDNKVVDLNEIPENKSNMQHIENIPKCDNVNNLIIARNIPKMMNNYDPFNKTEDHTQSTEINVMECKSPIYNNLTYLDKKALENSLHENIFPSIGMSAANYLQEKSLENTGDESIMNNNYFYNNEQLNNTLPSLPCGSNKNDAYDSPRSIYPRNINENNAHIKRFSYSTSKINIHVKDTRDHKVHIISKLKVDLDVTQIVSEKTVKDDHNTNQTNVGVNYNLRSESPIRFPLMVNTEFDNDTNTNQKLQSQHASVADNKYIISSDNTDFENYKKHKTFNSNGAHENPSDLESCSKSQKDSNYLEQPEPISKPLYLPTNNLNEISGMGIQSIEEKDTDNKSINDKFDTNESLLADKGKTEDEDISKIGNYESSVKNVLQKYSLLFGKGVDQKPKTEMQSQEKDEGRSKTPCYSRIKPMIESFEAKRKKPFKISELHSNPNKIISKINLEPQISIDSNENPNIRVYSREVNNTRNENKDVMQFGSFNDNKNNTFSRRVNARRNNDRKDMKHIESFNENKTVENDHTKINTPTLEYDTETMLHSQISNSPIDYDLPVDEIDSAMFNPKTMLQCYQTESEEIIPPPFQFCDSDNKHSNHVLKTDLNEMGDSNDYTSNECDLDANNASIFEYDDKEQLTPTKEIETWTLSLNDYETTEVSGLKSCTVMRKVSPHYKMNSTPPRFNINNRNKKLSVFKLEPKSRMKLN